MTTPKHHIDRVLQRGLAFLAGAQLPSGEIPVDRYDHPGLEGDPLRDSSPFGTTFAVYALHGLADVAAHAIVERGIAFLLQERRSPGLWSYWAAGNAQSIAPDLDVTACAAAALRNAAPTRHTDAADVLLQDNRTVRGLFKTWLRPLHEPNDVSPCVNANALLYLGDGEQTQGAVDYLVTVVNHNRDASPDWYYPGRASLYYMIARAHAAGVGSLAACRETIVEASARPGETALESALHLCTLHYLDAAEVSRAQPLVQTLIDAQQPGGAWPRAAFYRGPEAPGPHAFWWGSEALTTALCLEALGRHC